MRYREVTMEKLLSRLSEEMCRAFEGAGYEEKFGNVVISNRPDLCQYQCNGAMAAAKEYKKAPFMIAEEVVAKLGESEIFSKAEVVKPGFINLDLRDEFLAGVMSEMAEDIRYGSEKDSQPKKVVIDYGGPNVAKPLHVGHLRSAVIGESLKRIKRFMGNEVIGDVHLGDWGLQMGLIVAELNKRKPDLVYFDENYTGEYPKEPPFTIGELEEIYPYASAYSKEHPDFLEEAHVATLKIQQKVPGYYKLWQHIIDVSVEDLKKNYEKLQVSFDLWKGESDAQPFIPDMVERLKNEGYAYISEGALVVDVREETDTKEIPPCMILKSDGATLYNTTDLATMVQRRCDHDPDEMVYVVDKRQELYFTQVFRCARKCHILEDKVKLTFLGFGTVNGTDGKALKSRQGGVMRLESLLNEINDAVYDKILESRSGEGVKEELRIGEDEARKISEQVGMAALKYADLSNQASKDYIFDIKRFSSFDGNTGPYILYTAVRLKSILAKAGVEGKPADYARGKKLLPPMNESERNLMLKMVHFNEVVEMSYKEDAPHKLCQFLYETSDLLNQFYHGNKIIAMEDEGRRDSWLALISLAYGILETTLGLLGMVIPEKM